ncbi:hypothetical protein [Mesorhizobium sp. WSM2239]|uniref:Uncharacterized protein n=2 Tax=unclassified Mesorhizobium TaxID=325217 RepID=A0AAU8DJM8_9HYPH
MADGLQLDIQAALIHASGLFLIGAGTAKRYCDADLPAEQAGREMAFVMSSKGRRNGRASASASRWN